MMSKLRKKLNNSASLGKTLVRTQPNPHFSYYADPKEFQSHLIDDKRSRISKIGKGELSSTPKCSAGSKKMSRNIGVSDSLIKIKNSRNKCARIGEDVHTALMDKSMKLNMMYKDVYHFAICVDELKWLLTEGDSLIKSYLSQANLIAPHSAHTIDLSNIAQEFRSLVLRFQRIQKGRISCVQQYFNNQKLQKMCELDHINLSYLQDMRQHEQKIPIFNDLHSLITSKERLTEPYNISRIDTKNNTCAMKENINLSNTINHFENIDLMKPEPKKRQKRQKAIPTHSSLQVQEKEDLDQQKQLLYNKLHNEHNKIQQLSGKNELLMEEISNLEKRILKYKIISCKSIEKLSEVLRRLMENVGPEEKEFQLLKMAQCIANWQKMKDEDFDEQKYKELYLNADRMQTQRTSKLQEIITLQYDINHLLAQRRQIQEKDCSQREREKDLCNEDYYRMLMMQACTLQEVSCL